MQHQTGLKVVFAGTPEFAEHHLSALLNSHHQVLAVYTQPDRPAGRGKKLQASPVKQRALESDIPVQQPPSLKDSDTQQTLKQYNADILIVVAYGLLLPQAVLDIPKLGCINVHASILPRWRGAAPIQRAIEAGDLETGITIMQMDSGLDTGDMLSKTFCPLLNTDTASTLHDRLANLGPDALLETLGHIKNGTVTPEPQDNNLATYAHKLTKAEAALDWHLDAQTLDKQIRAFNPFPIATAKLKGESIRIHKASANRQATLEPPGTILSTHEGIEVVCGMGALRIESLQLPGKKALTSKEILNGSPDKFKIGSSFDCVEPTTTQSAE